jgi:site-specific recombinase XerD
MNYIAEFCDLYTDCANTARSYIVVIKQYSDWCEEQYGWDMQDVVDNSNKRTAMLFLNYLASLELSPFTINQRHSGLLTFFKYLCELEYRTTNPFENIRRQNTKMIEQKTSYITYEEFQDLIEAVNTKTRNSSTFEFTSARDTLLITTLFTVGLRISEALNMKFSDIDLETRTIKIVGKGSKFRRVPITDDMLRCLDRYKSIRSEYTFTDYVFVSVNGKQLDPRDGNRNLQKYCKRANIDKDISNHSLRHSSATHYIRQGVDTARVATLLGHSSVAITGRYTHLDENDLDFVK